MLRRSGGPRQKEFAEPVSADDQGHVWHQSQRKGASSVFRCDAPVNPLREPVRGSRTAGGCGRPVCPVCSTRVLSVTAVATTAGRQRPAVATAERGGGGEFLHPFLSRKGHSFRSWHKSPMGPSPTKAKG